MHNWQPFARSAYISLLQALAPKEEVEAELKKMLRLQGLEHLGLEADLARLPVTVFGLNYLRQWARILAPHTERDVYGKAYAKFGAATAILKAVVSTQALDPKAPLPDGLAMIMFEGAEGLLDLGFTQFSLLAKLTRELADWISDRGFRSVALIESPIGNSVPVQVLQSLLEKRGVAATSLLLTAPRNDKKYRGRTVKEAASQCADRARNFDCTVFIAYSKRCRSAFRTDGDHHSNLMPIAIPK